MNRSELEFHVVYSMFMEDMMRTLLGRLDRLASFLQILLGVAVISAEAPKLTGAVVALVAAYQLVWQPGVNAGKAASAFDRWSSLYYLMSSLSSADLQKRVDETSKVDSVVLGSLKVAAHRAASVKLNLQLTDCPDMTRWGRLIAWFAGGQIH